MVGEQKQKPTPSILVKKEDGSTQRMSWAELQAHQRKKNPTVQKVEKKVVEPVVSEPKKVEEKPLVESKAEEKPVSIGGTEALSTTTPVKEIFVDEAKAKGVKWSKQDHTSPLEEELEKEIKEKDLPVLPGQKDDLLSNLLKEIKFPLKDELLSRVSSLAISRIKGVRVDEQVIKYALKPEERGGLGFNEKQAVEILEAIKRAGNISNKSRLEQKVEERNEELKKKDQDGVRMIVPLERPEKVEESSLRRKKEIGKKPVLHDVVAPEPEKKSMGPIDELKFFSLVDLRRLGAETKQSENILEEKFSVLKKESYLLYLQAVQAWRESPLYKQYQEIIKQGINEGVQIKDVLAGNGKEGLKWEEFVSLAGMMRELGI